MADTATSPVPVSVETRGDGGAPRLCACAGSLAWRGWLLIVGALMFFVGACAEEASQSETVLRVANWGGIAVEGDFMRLEREFREEFERKHGVRVQFEQIPGFGQYAPKVLMMHATCAPLSNPMPRLSWVSTSRTSSTSLVAALLSMPSRSISRRW
jgi:hypothetical protein